MRVRADGRIRKIQAEDRKRAGAHRQNARADLALRDQQSRQPPLEAESRRSR